MNVALKSSKKKMSEIPAPSERTSNDRIEEHMAHTEPGRDALQQVRVEWQEAWHKVIGQRDVLQTKLAAAEAVIEAAEVQAPVCVNFSPECPYNCYRVDPQPYLTMPCLACALATYRATHD